VSQAFIQATLASWTDEILLICLTFDHDDLASPIRLVNDTQDLVRSAGTFTAFPFDYQDYVRGEDQTAEVIITADNVDQRIIEALRGLSSRPTVTYELVLRSSPNTIEKGPIEFEIVGFEAALGMISLRASPARAFLGYAHPKDYFSPGNAV
jgi:hypothetical protein